MNYNIRAFAVKTAVGIFFLMCFIGQFKKHEPDVCCKRALAGAVIAYLLVSLTGKVVINMVINILADEKVKQKIESENASQQEADN